MAVRILFGSEEAKWQRILSQDHLALPPSAIAEDSDCTTLVCQATSMPDLELVRLRQAEEERDVFCGGRRRDGNSGN